MPEKLCGAVLGFIFSRISEQPVAILLRVCASLLANACLVTRNLQQIMMFFLSLLALQPCGPVCFDAHSHLFCHCCLAGRFEQLRITHGRSFFSVSEPVSLPRSRAAVCTRTPLPSPPRLLPPPPLQLGRHHRFHDQHQHHVVAPFIVISIVILQPLCGSCFMARGYVWQC